MFDLKTLICNTLFQGELEEADEFEMDDDYGVDHYASDDGGDDDNMEATF
jgi:hypothetical protein